MDGREMGCGSCSGARDGRAGCGRGFNEMWNSSGMSPRRAGCGRRFNEMWKLLWRESASGRMWLGGIMGCGSCSGVNTRWAGCGRAGNGMWGLLWRESALGWMWTGGKWDVEAALARVMDGVDVDEGSMGCGSYSGAREDGALPICGLSTFGALRPERRR